jgi:Protein of unknown function (DUF3800)
MHLRPRGIDVYYIDESHDGNHYVVTAVRIPFLRNVKGSWQIVWPSYLDRAKMWRKQIREKLYIPRSKELHGVKLASGRGQFLHGKHNFKYKQAANAYGEILRNVDFLLDESVMSVSATKGKNLFGHRRLEAAMYALFQRMRRKAVADRTNAIVFFDQGHPEYGRLYRMAQVRLPTGSAIGQWESGTTKNIPMDMFTKDGNEKNSKHCYFTQAADLIAYAAFLKIKGEHDELADWQKIYAMNSLYDSLPRAKINTKASNMSPRDGIVRLK